MPDQYIPTWKGIERKYEPVRRLKSKTFQNTYEYTLAGYIGEKKHKMRVIGVFRQVENLRIRECYKVNYIWERKEVKNGR